MARFRRRFRRRRFRNRRSFKRKFAIRHKSMGRFPRAELKFHDPSQAGLLAGFVADSATMFFSLNNVAEGASAYQRIGRRINMKNLLYRITLVDPGLISLPAGTDAVVFRCALVYDAQANGAFPAAVDLFANIPSLGSPSNSIFAPVNLNNRDRFLILKDKLWTYVLGSTAAGTSPSTVSSDLSASRLVTWKGFMNLRGLETTYSTTVAAANQLLASGVTTGNLFFFCQAASVARSGSESAATFHWLVNARLRFYD